MQPTWHQLIRSHLPPLDLPPQQEEEAVAELAQLLEDAAVEDGVDPDSSDAVNLWMKTQIPQWKALAQEIENRHRSAKTSRPLAPGVNHGEHGKASLDGLILDCRFALRKLVKDRGFTAAVLLTLAVGIGLNTAVFGIINAVLFKPLPVADSRELVNIYSYDTAATSMSQMPMSFPDFQDLKEQSTSLAALAGHTMVELVWEVDETCELITGELVTGNFFSTLGVEATLGRTITAGDDLPGYPSAIVVLSHSTWQRRFGEDPGIIGQEIRLNGRTYTIVGVTPAGFSGLTRGFAPPLWIPVRSGYALGATSTMRMGTATAGVDRFADRNPLWIWAIGRLKPAVRITQLESEIETIATRLQNQYPETNGRRSYLLHATDSVRVLPMIDTILFGSSAVVMAIVVLILLIASTNIANMALARVAYRRKEIVTRLALGASRSAVIRQLQLESLLLALAGGVLGLGLALATNKVLAAFDSQITLDLSLDLRVFFFTLVVTTLSAVAFGLAPAFAATRVSISNALHGNSRGATNGRAKRRLRAALVVAQVAMSMLLLICAGLSLRSVLNAHQVDPGFDSSNVAVAEFAPNLQGYSEERAEEFYDNLRERLAAHSGIRSIGYANFLPLTFSFSSAGVAAENESRPPEEWPQIGRTYVSPGYFATLGIPILKGRSFSEHDSAEDPPVAIVNQTMAELLWPNEDAIGKRLKVDDGSKELYLVVGVARNGKYWTLGEEPRPHIFRSLTQHPQGQLNIVVRSEGNLQLALSAIRREARALDERIAITGLEPLAERISDSLLLPRASALLFGFAGLAGLLLATFGLYGVISYGVSQRTREIGIRMALGARPLSIIRLAVQEAVILTALGAALGILAAVATTKALSSVLYGISATDTLTFFVVPLLLIAVALIAALIPARRASVVDPVQALYCE